MTVKPVEIDPNKATKAQIAAGIALLAKAETRTKRVKAGELKSYSYADLSEEDKVEARKKNKFMRTKKSMILQKASDAGITVTDAEVNAAIASM